MVALLPVCLESAMKPRGKAVQLAMHCRCGREAVLAHGMCATCYRLRRHDEEHFGGPGCGAGTGRISLPGYSRRFRRLHSR